MVGCMIHRWQARPTLTIGMEEEPTYRMLPIQPGFED